MPSIDPGMSMSVKMAQMSGTPLKYRDCFVGVSSLVNLETLCFEHPDSAQSDKGLVLHDKNTQLRLQNPQFPSLRCCRQPPMTKVKNRQRLRPTPSPRLRSANYESLS